MPTLEVEQESKVDFKHLLRGSFQIIVYSLRQGRLPSEIEKPSHYTVGEWRALLEAARQQVTKEGR